MESMRVPSVILKIFSKIIEKKIMDETATMVAVNLSEMEVISGDNATTMGIHITLTARNEDIPKLVKKLGIM